MAIGLFFFLRAASKDRTTVLELCSLRPPLEVLDGLSEWLEERGWSRVGGDAEKQILSFRGEVSSSKLLIVLLSIFGCFGAGCIGLVVRQLYPIMGWWPICLIFAGPIAGLIYHRRSKRFESLELRLIGSGEINNGSKLRVKAHRDELIALEVELANSLEISSDGSLLSSPI